MAGFLRVIYAKRPPGRPRDARGCGRRCSRGPPSADGSSTRMRIACQIRPSYSGSILRARKTSEVRKTQEAPRFQVASPSEVCTGLPPIPRVLIIARKLWLGISEDNTNSSIRLTLWEHASDPHPDHPSRRGTVREKNHAGGSFLNRAHSWPINSGRLCPIVKRFTSVPPFSLTSAVFISERKVRA